MPQTDTCTHPTQTHPCTVKKTGGNKAWPGESTNFSNSSSESVHLWFHWTCCTSVLFHWTGSSDQNSVRRQDLHATSQHWESHVPTLCSPLGQGHPSQGLSVVIILRLCPTPTSRNTARGCSLAFRPPLWSNTPSAFPSGLLQLLPSLAAQQDPGHNTPLTTHTPPMLSAAKLTF